MHAVFQRLPEIYYCVRISLLDWKHLNAFSVATMVVVVAIKEEKKAITCLPVIGRKINKFN